MQAGLPLFSLLFALSIEPLSQYIRQTKGISGVNMAKVEQKLSLFVDDALFFYDQALSISANSNVIFGKSWPIIRLKTEYSKIYIQNMI